MGTKEIKNTSVFFTSLDNLEDQIVIKKNSEIFLIGTLVMIGLIVIVLTNAWTSFLISLLLTFLFSILSLIGIWIFLDRSVQLSINQKGIKANRQRLVQWKEIKNTFIEIEIQSGGDSHSTYYKLIIETNSNRKLSIDLTYLDMDHEWIADKVEGFKIRHSKIGLTYKIKSIL